MQLLISICNYIYYRFNCITCMGNGLLCYEHEGKYRSH